MKHITLQYVATGTPSIKGISFYSSSLISKCSQLIFVSGAYKTTKLMFLSHYIDLCYTIEVIDIGCALGHDHVSTFS